MENISRMVSDSLARNGVELSFDHLRLEWSRWFRCESSFSVLLAPCKPGIFALGEEVIPLVEGNQRMLALFQVAETDDLGMTLGRLFLPGNPMRERLAAGRCFARYTVIEDHTQRTAAYGIFQRWMQESAEAACGIGSRGVNPCGAGALACEPASSHDTEIFVSEFQPSSSFAWGMGVQNREAHAVKVRPAPLPSGF